MHDWKIEAMFDSLNQIDVGVMLGKTVFSPRFKLFVMMNYLGSAKHNSCQRYGLTAVTVILIVCMMCIINLVIYLSLSLR